MIGLTSLRTNGPPPEAPDLKHRRALRVLEKIDEILERERVTEGERDTRFIELGRYLCEVRAGQYWRVDKLHSFVENRETFAPETRQRTANYLPANTDRLALRIGNGQVL